MDILLEKKYRVDHREIPLAPILDLLVIVIFFLVLSVSFVEYTKQTLPPASVTSLSDPNALPPLSPRLALVVDGKMLKLWIVWFGEKPGSLNEKLSIEDASASKAVLEKVSTLAKQFHDLYPGEKSIQLGLSGQLPYQIMVAAMDGVQPYIPDVVLISSLDAEGIASAAAAGGKDAGKP